MANPFNNIKMTLQMPTEEELRERSARWLENIGPTLIDNWPKAMHELSVPTTFVEIDPEKAIDFFEGGLDTSPYANELADKIDAILGWKPKFFRLNSRSPKDGCWPLEMPLSCSGKQIISSLACSERILDDLAHFRWTEDQKCYLCLRDQIFGMQPSSEFRCFVMDRKLVGVTYYRYDQPEHAPSEHGISIRAQIQKWFEEQLEPILHIDTVVFDVVLGGSRPITLIELNPWGLSDPCCFKNYEEIMTNTTSVKFPTQ